MRVDFILNLKLFCAVYNIHELFFLANKNKIQNQKSEILQKRTSYMKQIVIHCIAHFIIYSYFIFLLKNVFIFRFLCDFYVSLRMYNAVIIFWKCTKSEIYLSFIVNVAFQFKLFLHLLFEIFFHYILLSNFIFMRKMQQNLRTRVKIEETNIFWKQKKNKSNIYK